MTPFQLVIVPLLAILILVTGAAIARHRITARAGALWIVLWLAAAIAVANPSLLVQLARLLGIGRGADLVMYVAILAGLAAFFLVYLRLRRLEAHLTRVVRELALKDAERH